MFMEQITSGLDLFRIPAVSPLGAGIEKPSDDHAGLADNLESWVLLELHRADRSAHISIPRGRGRTRIVGDFPDLCDGHSSRSARLWPRPAGDSEELTRVIGRMKPSLPPNEPFHV
jgi:hypothetical protein